MHATFIQNMYTNGKITESIGGEIWLSKPSYFKWLAFDTKKKTVAQTLIANDKDVKYYDHDLQQESALTLEESDNPYFLVMNNRIDKLLQSSQISKIAEKDNTIFCIKQNKQNGTITQTITKMCISFAQGTMIALKITNQDATRIEIALQNHNFSVIAPETYNFKMTTK